MSIVAIPTNNSGINSAVPSRSQNARYCEYVDNAGFDPILVPMEADPNVIAHVADYLLLAGGIDVDPIFYGGSNQCSHNVDPEKDAAERNLLHAFLAEEKPVFGICRGAQLIFRDYVSSIGNSDYFEYLEHVPKHSQTSDLNVRRNIPTHLVRANTGSLFGIPEDDGNIDMVPVNSMHHQAATINYMRIANENWPEKLTSKELSKEEPSALEIDGFELVAWSMRGIKQPKLNNGKPDYNNYWSIIEAFKIHNMGAPVMAVQWHPEELGDIRILKNFFEPTDQENLADMFV